MSGEEGDKFFNLEDLNADYGRKYRRTKHMNRNKENVVVDSAVADRCALSSSTGNEYDHSTRVNRINGPRSYSVSQDEPITSVHPSNRMLTESTPDIVRMVGKRRKLGELPRSGHLNETVAKCSSHIVTPRSNSRVNYMNLLEGSQDGTPLSDVTNSGSATFSRNMLRGKENYLGFGRELFANEIVSDDEEESNDFNEVAPSVLSDDSEGSDYEASDCESSGKKNKDSRRAPRRVVPEEYASLDGSTAICSKCHAQMWKEERVNKNVTKGCPIFSLCCMKGAVRLPQIPPTPEYFLDLYNDKKRGPTFHRLIRLYNTIFAFKSTGGNIDHSINNGRAPYVFRLNGQNHHVFGSLIPNDNETPKFCQLYIYDTINEVDNRLRWVSVHDRESVDKEVVRGLITMLDETNQLVGEFRQQRDLYESDEIVELQIILKVIRSESGRECHISRTDEVAGIMVGDTEETCGDRDIVVNEKGKGLVRVSYVHPKLMALQYPILFPRGEDGFHPKIKFQKTADSSCKPRGFLSLKNYYSYTFQIRESDGKKMMEYVPGCIAPNCPDIISRVFRLKLDQLMVDIKDKKHFGVCIGVMYVVEFRKRGLPHVHMLIWLDADSKKNLKQNVDNFVFAEIPDPIFDPVGYAAVNEFMIHGPCGLQNVKSPCMKDLRWIRHFPKKYCARTTFDDSGFPMYIRRRTNITVKIRKAELDNQWVVPYNWDLLVNTFHDACKEYGLLDDDKEWHEVLTQASAGGLPPQVRQLFVHIIVNCKVTDLKTLWSTHWKSMVDDILLRRRQSCPNTLFTLNDMQLQFYALGEIDELLRLVGKSLKKFDQLPQPRRSYLNNGTNNLIIEETSYDTRKMEYETAKLLQDCTEEQRKIYDAVIQSIDTNVGGIFFVYGSGGCGKTFLWRTLICKLRSQGKIVLPVASSRIVATLMPSGRTAHSRFKIPIVLDECSTCNIAHDSDVAQLIKQTQLIIWDEVPIQHMYAFECLDRSLKDIMKAVDPECYAMPFCGITVVLGGDFRQILPVITYGDRADIVAACITRSRLWSIFQVFLMTENMRLKQAESDSESEELKKFAKWVLDIGNGQHITNFSHKGHSTQYLSERAILTPTNQIVGHLNSLIVDKLPGESVSYFSVDAAEEFGGTYEDLNEAFPIEYLNSLNVAGMPPHDLKLKVGAVVMLMRNLNQTLSLCNGTRMIVTKCLRFCVECEVICGTFVGLKHFILRIELSPSDTKMPFKLVLKQMSLQICYAMTINKSQGQSLKTVGLYLPKSVFSHGQYYVAISRVTSPTGLTIFVDDDSGAATNITQNVVYKEVFYGLPEA
ncbi:uncharacterized protein LOC141719037 [Apium graveolens]|uniref:uncharacterized protein LOC141719037 n=1 Tax=Apium graveolens TaxID=4045 RepID=UPI003D7B5204